MNKNLAVGAGAIGTLLTAGIAALTISSLGGSESTVDDLAIGSDSIATPEETVTTEAVVIDDAASEGPTSEDPDEAEPTMEAEPAALTELDSVDSETSWNGHEGTLQWLVPADAPWSSFPGGFQKTCWDEEFEWLSEHGAQVWPSVFLKLRNEGTGGGAISLRDVRAEGSIDDRPMVLFECSEPIGGEVFVNAGSLVLDSQSVGVFEETLEGGGSDWDPYEDGTYEESYGFDNLIKGEPGTPILFNLQAGESAQLVLDVSSTKAFTGRVIATASAGGEDQFVVLADGFGVDKAARPAIGSTYAAEIYLDELYCKPAGDEYAPIWEMSPEQSASLKCDANKLLSDINALTR